jgi:hypothetical protein
MPKNTIKKQVAAALADSTVQADADEYLKSVRENMRSTEDSIIKVGRTLLVVIIGFEFLARGAISEASIAGLKFTDLSLIQKILPVLIAYLTYWLHSLYAFRRLLSEAHNQVMEKTQPAIYINDLDYYVKAHSAFSTENLLASNTEGIQSKFIGNLTKPFMLVIALGPTLFEIYAFYRCFSAFGIHDLIVWVVLIVSVPFVVQSLLFIWGTTELTS